MGPVKIDFALKSLVIFW